METLIIYDNEGFVLSTISGETLREPIGIPHMYITIPKGKKVKCGFGVDVSVTPNRVIFEDVTPTETEQLQKQVEAQAQAIATQEQAIAELTTIVAMNYK